MWVKLTIPTNRELCNREPVHLLLVVAGMVANALLAHAPCTKQAGLQFDWRELQHRHHLTARPTGVLRRCRGRTVVVLRDSSQRRFEWKSPRFQLPLKLVLQ
jgi:hypothetical protein